MKLAPNRTRLLPLLLLCTGLLLGGCSPAVTTSPAASATDPQCAVAMIRTPDSLAGMKRRETTSQGNTAYGDPAKIIVTCGVTPPSPTTDKCVNVNGVDWIIREAKNTAGASPASPGQKSNQVKSSNLWSATTYGRTPAIEVVLDVGTIPSSNVLPDLASAAKVLKQERRCL